MLLAFSLLVGLALGGAPAASDPVAPGRKALLALEYERALKLLSPVADDDELPRPVRAEAFVLIAQAHFGIAAPQAEERARAALRSAFRLDRNVELQDREDLSPRLVSLFDELQRALPRKPDKPDKPDKPPPDKPDKPDPPERAPQDDDPPQDEPPLRAPPPLPPSSSSSSSSGPSPWLVGAGVGAGVAAIALIGVVASELYLGGVPPGTSADTVRAVQTVGAASVVVAGVAVVAAGVSGVVGLAVAE